MQQDSFEPLPKTLKYLVLVIVVIELAATAQQFGVLPIDHLRQRLVIYGGLWSQYLTGEWEPLYFGQPVTMLVSHAFIHGGVLHMAMNVAILLALGKQFSRVLGTTGLMVLFVFSAAAGGALFVLLNNSGIPAVGASGAGFGFFGFWKYLQYKSLRHAGLPLTPVFQFIAVMVVINIVLWLLFDGLLAWEAHLGGFVGGWLIGIIFDFRRRQIR